MKVPLPRQTIAYSILANTNLSFPVITYFGSGSRIPINNFIFDIYTIHFRWFHEEIKLSDKYSTQFITNIKLNGEEYKEKIIYTIPRYTGYTNFTYDKKLKLHNISYNFSNFDKNIFSLNRENLTENEIRNIFNTKIVE